MEIATLKPKGGDEILLLGRYKVLKPLGEGRFGRVYLVKDLLKCDLYALKEAKDPIYREQLLNEAQNVLLIDHPHLVKLHHYFLSRDGKKIYLLYEYCDGGSLKQLVEKSGGKLSPERALEILKQVAKGLAYLHRYGYIHLDIKPENVLAKQTDKGLLWKLGDFGLLKPRGFSGILDVKGTVGYIAPEVFRGEIHRSSDIFSLGCLLYYMLEGHHPFKGRTKIEEQQLNRRGVVPIPKNLPEGWKEVFQRMVKINPTERYRTAQELLQDLEKLG